MLFGGFGRLQTFHNRLIRPPGVFMHVLLLPAALALMS